MMSAVYSARSFSLAHGPNTSLGSGDCWRCYRCHIALPESFPFGRNRLSLLLSETDNTWSVNASILDYMDVKALPSGSSIFRRFPTDPASSCADRRGTEPHAKGRQPWPLLTECTYLSSSRSDDSEEMNAMPCALTSPVITGVIKIQCAD
jgi:hypothetical protein